MEKEVKKPPMRLTKAELAARISWARDNNKKEFLNICEELQRRRARDEPELHSRVVDLAHQEVSKYETQIAVLKTDKETLQHKLRTLQREHEELIEKTKRKPRTRTKK